MIYGLTKVFYPRSTVTLLYRGLLPRGVILAIAPKQDSDRAPHGRYCNSTLWNIKPEVAYLPRGFRGPPHFRLVLWVRAPSKARWQAGAGDCLLTTLLRTTLPLI